MPPRKIKREVSKENSETQPTKKSKVAISHPSHCTKPGVVLTVGEGDVGQLGLGENVMERKKPGLVNIPEKTVQILAGGMHTVCLTEKGKIYTFGCNDEGALGRDTSEEGSECSPCVVDFHFRAVQISAGDSHTAALTDDGKVFAWGTFRDSNGVIGLTSTVTKQTTPLEMLPNQRVLQIASGADHLCMLTSGADIYSVGAGEQGQLGRIAECFSSRGGRKGLKLVLEPSKVNCRKIRGVGKMKFDNIWCSAYCTYARAVGVGVFAWGLNNYHHLGVEDTRTWFVPQLLTSCSHLNITSISGGQHHTVLLDDKGHAYSIGRTDYGRLGLGDDAHESHEPQRISTITDTVVGIGSGGSVSLAVTKKGDAYSWGMGSSLQLGTGEEDDEYTPVIVKGKQLETRKVIMVSVGGQHTVLLAVDD